MSRYKHRGRFETASGRVIDIRKLTPHDIDWEEIISSLSKICRFQGHCTKFFSVLSHSVLAHIISRKLWPQDKDIHIAALIHDAAEAFIGDIISPIRGLPGMHVHKKYERQLIEVISKAAFLDPAILDDKRVKVADNLALVNEVKRIVASRGELPIWDMDFEKYADYADSVCVTWWDFAKARWLAKPIFRRALCKHLVRSQNMPQ